MVFIEGSSLINPYNSGYGEGIRVREHTPHSTSMLSSLMRLGGEITSLVKKDFKDLKIRVDLFGLDMVIIKDRIKYLAQTKQLPRTAPMMSMFAVAPVAAQVDQPVEAYVDCEEGVRIDAITLHPDGGTPNGGVYCSDDEENIHPAVLKCAVVEAGGHYVGEGPDICWDDNQPLGLNFEPFTRNGPLYSPAPIMPPATPTAPQTPMERQSTTPEVEGKRSISLDNMDKRGKNALKVSAGLIAASILLFTAGVASRILTGSRPGTGSGKVSVTSEYPHRPDQLLPPEPKVTTQRKNRHKPTQPTEIIDNKLRQRITDIIGRAIELDRDRIARTQAKKD